MEEITDPDKIDIVLEIIPKVTELNLSNSSLPEHQLDYFFDCQKLQKLEFNFMYDQFSYLERAFSNFTKLIELSLDSCKLNDLNMSKLIQILPKKKIRLLSLNDNNLSDDGIESLM